MNKNKIIFSVIGIVIVLIILLLVSSLNSGTKKVETNSTAIKDFTIWIVGDDKQKFSEFLGVFKSKNPKYANTNIIVESFPDYNDYYYSLVGAFLSGKAPDIFVLNNSEKKSVFEEQIMGLDPNLIDPDQMTSEFEPVFGTDLIMQTEMELEDGTKSRVDFIKGIPLGYESLGLFYSFRDFKGKDFSTWAGLNDAISSFNQSKDGDIIGIGLGNGTTVNSASDIITQFFVQNGLKSLDEVQDKKMLQAFYSYMMYGSSSLGNNYNEKFSAMIRDNKSNLDLFSRGEVAMLIGYPSLLKEIDEKGFQKSFLRASPIPQNAKTGGESLIRYNYFVMNKNSEKLDLSKDLMSFFFTEEAEKEYQKIFPYYLPSHLSLLSRRLDEKINPEYNLEYGNFYNSEALLVSFDKKSKVQFDEKIISILDDSDNYKFLFEKFQKSLLCKYNKMINISGLSLKCE